MFKVEFEDTFARVVAAGEWRGFRVVDGDTTDLRHNDPRGVVVALKAKGRAKADCSGFVVRESA